MVTIQEIEEREQQLKEVEVQAIEASRTPIPQRRYGAGVTPEQQRLAQARRTEGQNVIIQVENQRKDLQTIRGQVIENQKIQGEIDAANAKQAAYERAVKLVENDRGYVINWLKGPEYSDLRKYVRELEKQKKYAAQDKEKVLAKYAAQGLKPVYNAGKLVGFEDTIRQQSIGLEAIPKLPGTDLLRYEKAGVVTLEVVPVNKLSNEQILAKLNINETEAQKKFIASSNLYVSQKQMSKIGYQPFFGKVEKVIKYPFEKVATAIEKPTKEPQYITNVISYTPLKTETIPYEVYQTRRAKAVRFVGELVAFPVYGFKQTERYVMDKKAREEFAVLTPLNKALEITNIGFSYWSAGSLAKSGLKFLKEPIKIKEEFKLPEEYFAKTEIKNIRINEKMINVAEFNVIGVSYPQRAVTIPRWEAVLRGLKLNDPRLDKYSIDQLRNMLSSSKVVELKPLRISQSVTEPFLVRGGRITNALGRTGQPGVFSFRQSIYTLKGETRFTSRKLSILSGETYNSRSIRTISESRRELSPNVKKALEEIEKLKSPKELSIKEIFDKELNLQEGGVKLEDFFKITNKRLVKEEKIDLVYNPLKEVYDYAFPKAKVYTGGIKPIPYGKRTSRADIAAIQKSLYEVKFEGREYGLKEVEILGEKIGVVDTTFPARMREVKIKDIREINPKVIIDKNLKENLGLFIPNENKIVVKNEKDIETFLHETFHKRVKTLPKEIDIFPSSAIKELLGSKKVKGYYLSRGYNRIEITEEAFADIYSKYGISKTKKLDSLGKNFPETKKAFENILGLKEFEYPKLTQLKEYPRKAINIKGIVNRYEYEIPYSEPVNIMRGRGPRTIQTFSSKDQKVIQQAIGSVAVNQAKLPTKKLNILKSEPILKPVEKSLPAYAGTGLYERTEEVSARYSPSYQMPSYVPSYRPMVREINIPKFDYSEKYFPRELTKDISKTITKDIVKELAKNIPKLSPKEITKQAPKEITKQIPKFNVKNPPKISLPPYNPPNPKPPKEFKFPLINLGEGKPKDYVPGYKPFVIKKGEKEYIGDIQPRGKALREAEEEAKKTLRATFGVEKTKTKIKEIDINFTPSKKLFRDFRIKEGKKIPLKDIYIQKLGKRLSSKGEISEIQIARRFKL